MINAALSGTNTAPSAANAPLVVCYLDHTAKWSGGEIALLRTLRETDRARVMPVVLLAEDGPLVSRLAEIGVETHVLPLAESVREVRKDTLGAGALLRYAGLGTQFVRYAFAVAGFARKRGAQVLHCNSLKSDLYGALAGRVAQIPVLWHIRDHVDPSYLPGAAVKALRALAKSAPAFVAVNSQSTWDKLFPAGAGRQRTAVVHDGLPLAEFESPLPAEVGGWKNSPPRIGLIGRIVRWKGQHIFLQAAAKLKARGVKARFVVVGAALFGESEYEENLRKIVREAGMEDDVEFTGFQSDVRGILGGLDILVHASITPEPFGQVVIEGMAEGLPVIGTDGGGVREIVTQGENGLLVPLGDAEALGAAMETLLSDPARARRIARAGYSHVRANFTALHTARKLEEAYRQIAKLPKQGQKEQAAHES